MQTLITLSLERNNIGSIGAEHMANALRQNKVLLFESCSILIMCLFFYADTHQTQS